MANMKQLYEDKERTVEAYPRVWFPVGSLYWNENDISADINKYFVGTWVRVKDVFILAAGDTYQAKTNGGEASHTLTFDEMPTHSHNTYGNLPGTGGYGIAQTANSGRGEQSWCLTMDAGGNQPHNNMPPYYCAYCWKRTA